MTDSVRQRIEAARVQVESLKHKLQEQKARIEDSDSFDTDRDLADVGSQPRARRTLKGHFGKVYALHWSGNGHDIVSASQDGKLIIWNSHNQCGNQSLF